MSRANARKPVRAHPCLEGVRRGDLDWLAPVKALRAQLDTIGYPANDLINPIVNSPSRPNRINIDLQGYKQPWLDYCRANGVTPSEAFRQVVAKLTAQAPGARPVAEELREKGAKIRKELRLTSSELRRAEALAARDGFSLNRWIVALIIARLDGEPQLGQQELEILARSNLHLLAIGRNLNQLTRAANNGLPGVGPHLESVIVALKRVVMEHSRKVAAVLETNAARWRVK